LVLNEVIPAVLKSPSPIRFARMGLLSS
jgi:hypothetical protein